MRDSSWFPDQARQNPVYFHDLTRTLGAFAGQLTKRGSQPPASADVRSLGSDIGRQAGPVIANKLFARSLNLFLETVYLNEITYPLGHGSKLKR